MQIIEEVGFYDFYSLTSLTFTGNILKNIGSCAFCFAWVLKSITIPPSVTNISNSAFRGLDTLQEFQYCGSTAITDDVFFRDNFNGHNTPYDITVKVTDSYPISNFATDTSHVDKDLNCVFPPAATYDLVCKSNSCMYFLPEFYTLFVFMFI